MLRSNRFLVIGIVVAVVVVSALLLTYRALTLNSLIQQEERASATLTTILSRAVLPHYRDFYARARQLSDAELASAPQTLDLDRRIGDYVEGTNVIKVQIINADGRTLFSSQLSQIGNSKSASYGFQKAMTGAPSSEFSFRDRFNTTHATYFDRNVVATYVPIRDPGDGKVTGTFEIYSDVTDLVQTLEDAQLKVGLMVILSMMLIYGVLFAMARRADAVVRQQEAERLANEERVRYQAYHDPLTHLPNRTSFTERLEEVIHRAHRNDCVVGVMFLDLDNFKLVNDSHGHHTGDELLKICARRLKTALRESDLLFRMGGDEFTIIPDNIDYPEGGAYLAQRVLEAVRQPVIIDGQTMAVTASIGISVYPRDDTDLHTLIRNADAAMYLSKQNGGNQYCFYMAEMNAEALDQLNYHTALQQALGNDEFVLHYQPRVTALDGDITAVEALLRWDRPGHGLVPPDRFIPILEDRGLIVEVGDWVIQTAARQIRQWHAEGLGWVRVSVNVSSRQFHTDHFVDAVTGVLDETGIPADHLELELTESILLADNRHAVEVMRALRELGVKLSIDDFGSGYSSLNYLKLLPIDYLKIDRTFIADVTHSVKDAAIVHTITTLARALGIGVVAEGVETVEQQMFLRGQDCHELQGYLFSRPVDADAMRALLIQGNDQGAIRVGRG